MTHRDRAGDAPGQRAGRRKAAGGAGHRQGFPTATAGSPTAGSPARPERRFPKAFGQGADGVPHGYRCPESLRHALLAESLGKPSLWVIISAPWYKAGLVSQARIAAH